MKLAIVHDDLIQFGGAERLVMEMHNIWPEAPIYTSAASKKWQQICEEKNIDLRTSFMQKLPLIDKLYRYYSPFMLQVLAFEGFDFSDYDVVLSVSARYAHAVITRTGTTHICYMNSPGRMFWEPAQYFKDESYGMLSPLKALAPIFLKVPLSLTRLWDFSAAQRVDYFVANSKTPQSRIRKYYKRESIVIYPFVNFEEYSKLQPYKGGYFLVLTRLAAWKNVEIAVKACRKLNLPLKIAGTGPDEERLKKFADETTEFLGYVSEEQKKELLAGCTALINTQLEDFGIVPLEAMAAGKPVIAYSAGGVLETVIPGKTGEFFTEQTVESLIAALKNFDKEKYSTYDCRKQAKLFDESVFDKRLKLMVKRIYDEQL